jgi:hypothetical protein
MPALDVGASRAANCHMNIVAGGAIKSIRPKTEKTVTDLEKVRQLQAFNFDFAAGKDGAQPGLHIVNDFDAQEIVQKEADMNLRLGRLPASHGDRFLVHFGEARCKEVQVVGFGAVRSVTLSK